MTFQDPVRSFFQKSITPSGRARRSEYWWWVLFVIAGSLVMIGAGIAFALSTEPVMPAIAATSREIDNTQI